MGGGGRGVLSYIGCRNDAREDICPIGDYNIKKVVYVSGLFILQKILTKSSIS